MDIIVAGLVILSIAALPALLAVKAVVPVPVPVRADRRRRMG